MSKKAIFLDRDGVLINNNDHYYIWKTEQVSYVDGVFDNLKKLSDLGFLFFIVSNQGGISKGQYTKDDSIALHNELIQTFLSEGICITDVAFCPHHSNIESCLCRKPGSLMIEKLIAKYQIDKDGSYMIGDNVTDMEAASNAGIQGIKITPNQNMYPFISFLL